MSYEHFALRRCSHSLPRRRWKSGVRPPKREKPEDHAKNLVEQGESLAEALSTRQLNAPFDPKLIFKLQLHPKQGHISDDNIRRLGLHLLERTPERAIVVFPDEPAVSELQHRLRQHAGMEDGSKYTYLASIEEIATLEAADRLGSNLQSNPLEKEELALLDLSLWHPGDQELAHQWIDEIIEFINKQGGKCTDKWVGKDLCLLRIHVDAHTVTKLLEQDVVRTLERRPRPAFDMRELVQLGRMEIKIEGEPDEDAVGIVVIDSGVMQGHPLIAPALGDAQKIPDTLQGGAEDVDTQLGHGTAVAGIALYYDIGDSIKARLFRPKLRLFSARVMNEHCEYDEHMLIEHQLAEAVRYFVQNYPTIRVFNISLGNRDQVYTDGTRQFRLAATIDEIAYQYREQNILFVVSAGNYDATSSSNRTGEQVLQQYPVYLLHDKQARIIDPATSTIAITVGGLSYGGAYDIQQYMQTDTDNFIANTRDYPASLTRTGWGFRGSIKPEFVDYSGDQLFQRGRVIDHAPHAGVPTTNRNFVKEGKLFRTASGTSFAAPRVANIVARLFQAFPTASSNLIRALLADSARIPDKRPQTFANPKDDNLLRVYGYGQPNFARARFSVDNRTLLLHDGLQKIDTFQLFELPSLPSTFFTAKGTGYISVSLAFDPPTRMTRYNDYFGVTMTFKLFRNTSSEVIENVLRDYTNEQEKEFGEDGQPTLSQVQSNQITLRPGTNLRQKGTLQHATCQISSKRWTYNEDNLYLAIICKGSTWLPKEITNQRFAVVVSYQHTNEDVQVYQHVQQREQLYQRIKQRIRV